VALVTPAAAAEGSALASGPRLTSMRSNELARALMPGWSPCTAMPARLRMAELESSDEASADAILTVTGARSRTVAQGQLVRAPASWGDGANSTAP